MMDAVTVNKILTEAVRNGACEKSSNATDWRSLVWLFFTPQGAEFCAEHNYPSIDQFRAMSERVREYGVFVDAGAIEATNPGNIGLTGCTEAMLTITDPTCVHKIIVMHGAKVRIKAGNYAVIRLYNIGDNCVTIENDGTAVIMQ